jgi:hypothetical protein
VVDGTPGSSRDSEATLEMMTLEQWEEDNEDNGIGFQSNNWGTIDADEARFLGKKDQKRVDDTQREKLNTKQVSVGDQIIRVSPRASMQIVD